MGAVGWVFVCATGWGGVCGIATTLLAFAILLKMNTDARLAAKFVSLLTLQTTAAVLVAVSKEISFSAIYFAVWIPSSNAAQARFCVPYVIAANPTPASAHAAAACAAHDATTKHRVACQQQAIEHRNAAVNYQHEVAVEMLINWEAVTPG